MSIDNIRKAVSLLEEANSLAGGLSFVECSEPRCIGGADLDDIIREMKKILKEKELKLLSVVLHK
jgi:hypothetical protein